MKKKLVLIGALIALLFGAGVSSTSVSALTSGQSKVLTMLEAGTDARLGGRQATPEQITQLKSIFLQNPNMSDATLQGIMNDLSEAYDALVAAGIDPSTISTIEALYATLLRVNPSLAARLAQKLADLGFKVNQDGQMTDPSGNPIVSPGPTFARTGLNYSSTLIVLASGMGLITVAGFVVLRKRNEAI
jgi:hypothetical protein